MMPASDHKTAVASVSTILTADEQLRVDAAGTGLYKACHRGEPAEVLLDIKTRRSSCVLLSVQYCENSQWERVSRMIKEIPRIPTVAILSSETPCMAETLLRLGREGIQRVVDVRSPQGWRKLRTMLVDEQGDWIERAILQQLQSATDSMTEECWAFFQTTTHHSTRLGSVRELAEVLKVLPSTLMSRFYRAGLPTPKQYLSWLRLVRAAYLFENSGFSIANIANHLEYSSPQSFGRHIRTVMEMSAVEFRRHFTGRQMLNRFEEEFVRPYLHILVQFYPFSGTRPWV